MSGTANYAIKPTPDQALGTNRTMPPARLIAALGFIMQIIPASSVQRAIAPGTWDFLNSVLYQLCRNHPAHTNLGIVNAKLMLIGRTYAAEIERRRNMGVGENADWFYEHSVGPAIVRSKLDDWLREAAAISADDDAGTKVLLEVHFKTMELFRSISGMANRSLASKYLHFHLPEHFYIYDSRASESVNRIVGRAWRNPWPEGSMDSGYRNFVQKCREVCKKCKGEFQIELSPRLLDNLLLAFP